MGVGRPRGLRPRRGAGLDEGTRRRRAKAYGIDSPFALPTEIARYDVTPVVDRITAPLLTTDRRASTSGRAHHDALPGPERLAPFTEAEGTHPHCEPTGRVVFEQRVFDWPAEVLDRAPWNSRIRPSC
ncbi:hypothetical protein [Streptomyces brasiliensis]|uniref:Uncharacterized protein n=1 Tax=Streptomyces brasiliensis TaxID=1954 RepID=A0A917KHH8_9ACTN|nr:hypothetical protein [Streptomyces brasiliensis]GGJ13841.1 hypothetical protein GCM10010121_025530 [Streptomyces brasiliensis]